MRDLIQTIFNVEWTAISAQRAVTISDGDHEFGAWRQLRGGNWRLAKYVACISPNGSSVRNVVHYLSPDQIVTNKTKKQIKFRKYKCTNIHQTDSSYTDATCAKNNKFRCDIKDYKVRSIKYHSVRIIWNSNKFRTWLGILKVKNDQSVLLLAFKTNKLWSRFGDLSYPGQKEKELRKTDTIAMQVMYKFIIRKGIMTRR